MGYSWEEDYDRLRPLSYPSLTYSWFVSVSHPDLSENVRTRWVLNYNVCPGTPIISRYQESLKKITRSESEDGIRLAEEIKAPILRMFAKTQGLKQYRRPLDQYY